MDGVAVNFQVAEKTRLILFFRTSCVTGSLTAFLPKSQGGTLAHEFTILRAKHGVSNHNDT